MNKRLAVILLGAALASGAGAAGAKERLKMATIAPGTSAYLTMSTFANIVNQSQDEYEIQVDATGAATKHVIEVAQGKLDISMTSPTVHHFMKTGKAMYSKMADAPELSKKLKLLFWFPYGTYHVATYAEDGMQTLEDIRGKRVFLGPPGGGAWNTSKALIEAATGMVPEKDYQNVKASWASALQGFQDRQIDVYVAGCVDPCPQFEQLTVTSKIRFLGVDKATAENPPEALKKVLIIGREMDAVKAGTYQGQANESDVYTIASVVGVTARADLPEATVYKLMKTYWEGVDKRKADTPWLRNITREYAVRTGPMPLHPGALKYYDEIGLKVPDENRM
jgi:hypothetical protein